MLVLKTFKKLFKTFSQNVSILTNIPYRYNIVFILSEDKSILSTILLDTNETWQQSFWIATAWVEVLTSSKYWIEVNDSKKNLKNCLKIHENTFALGIYEDVSVCMSNPISLMLASQGVSILGKFFKTFSGNVLSIGASLTVYQTVNWKNNATFENYIFDKC